MEKGISLALGAIALWGVFDAISRLSVVSIGAQPVVFSCLNLLFGGLILIALGGRGWGGWETFKNPYTWAYGIIRIFMSVSIVLSYLYLTASESGFLLRISAVIVIFAMWAMFKKKPYKEDIPGILLMCLGFAAIALRQQDSLLNMGVLFITFAAVSDTFLNITAERHPISNQTTGFRTRCRYTGVVLAVSSLVFLIFTLVTNTLILPFKDDSPLLTQLHDWLPQLEDFLHVPTIGAALVSGLFFRAPIMYMYLFAARLVKADTILMLSTLGTFSILGAESVFSFFGLLDISTIDTTDIAAGTVMTIGALWMAYERYKRHKQEA